MHDKNTEIYVAGYARVVNYGMFWLLSGCRLTQKIRDDIVLLSN